MIVTGRNTVIVGRARKTTERRNIAEGLGEPGEHLEYPVVSRPQFPVGVFTNVV